MCVAVCFGQLKYDANWCFGIGAGMHFNGDGTVDIFHCETSNMEANATFSNAAGELLFYAALDYYLRQTKDIFGANNTLLSNGGGLTLGTSTTNGGVFIQDVGSSTVYYYYLGFYFDSLNPSNYSGLLSARLSWDGTGYVVDYKNQLLVTGDLQEKMAVAKSADQGCWWVVAHQNPHNGCSNSFVTLKVCDGMVVDSFTQQVGALQCNQSDFFGELTFSDDGKTLVCPLPMQAKVEVYGFNRCSGALSLDRTVTGFRNDGYVYGTEIVEPFIYLTETDEVAESSFVYQYSIDSSTLMAIYGFPGLGDRVAQMEQAPNGKIYISHYGLFSNFGQTNNSTQCLSVINNPDQPGLACNFEPFGFCFPDSIKMNYGLPNFPNYNLGPPTITTANAGKDTTLCSNTNSTGVTIGAPPVPNVTYFWQPAIGLSATYTAQPIANPTQSTWYLLTATDTTATSCAVNTDSVYIEVRTCVGITETSALQAKIYPNPTTGTLTVELPGTTGGIITLYNLLGQRVLEAPLTGKSTVLEINASPGIYLYQITAHNGQVQNGKLVVGE